VNIDLYGIRRNLLPLNSLGDLIKERNKKGFLGMENPSNISDGI
jgi:hypothetical protein